MTKRGARKWKSPATEKAQIEGQSAPSMRRDLTNPGSAETDSCAYWGTLAENVVDGGVEGVYLRCWRKYRTAFAASFSSLSRPPSGLTPRYNLCNRFCVRAFSWPASLRKQLVGNSVVEIPTRER